jgi:probable rRNA maturation factor
MKAGAPVYFFKENIRFRLDGASWLPKWIRRTIVRHGRVPGAVSFIFCNDAWLLRMNRRYLQHDTYTDILTFDQPDESGRVSGEIYISVDRVRSNAMAFGVSFRDELHRVMIHGILHLVGFRDKTARDQAVMRAEEDRCLARRPRR